MSENSSNWTKNIEAILDSIRLNCLTLEKHHKKLYFNVKNIVIYFKLPIIFLSSINAISAVAFTEYLDQKYISATNCGLSFIIGLMTSISLYLKIEDKLESELMASKEYHKLALEIYKTLSLEPDNRAIDGDQFLNDCYNEYVKLYEKTNLLQNEYEDNLKEITFGVNSNFEKV